jgi:hypothetical protein
MLRLSYKGEIIMYEDQFEVYNSTAICKLQASWNVFDITEGENTVMFVEADLPALIRMLQDYQQYLENK